MLHLYELSSDVGVGDLMFIVRPECIAQMNFVLVLAEDKYEKCFSSS